VRRFGIRVLRVVAILFLVSVLPIMYLTWLFLEDFNVKEANDIMKCSFKDVWIGRTFELYLPTKDYIKDHIHPRCGTCGDRETFPNGDIYCTACTHYMEVILVDPDHYCGSHTDLRIHPKQEWGYYPKEK